MANLRSTLAGIARPSKNIIRTFVLGWIDCEPVGPHGKVRLGDIGATQILTWTLPWLLFSAFIGVPLIKSVLAFRTTPPQDLVRIRAALGGIAGLAGVNRQVLDVRHEGGSIATRHRSARRRYRVAMVRPDGSEERCTVWIDVAFFFEGAMTVDRKALW